MTRRVILGSTAAKIWCRMRIILASSQRVCVSGFILARLRLKLVSAAGDYGSKESKFGSLSDLYQPSSDGCRWRLSLVLATYSLPNRGFIWCWRLKSSSTGVRKTWYWRRLHVGSTAAKFCIFGCTAAIHISF